MISFIKTIKKLFKFCPSFSSLGSLKVFTPVCLLSRWSYAYSSSWLCLKQNLNFFRAFRSLTWSIQWKSRFRAKKMTEKLSCRSFRFWGTPQMRFSDFCSSAHATDIINVCFTKLDGFLPCLGASYCEFYVLVHKSLFYLINDSEMCDAGCAKNFFLLFYFFFDNLQDIENRFCRSTRCSDKKRWCLCLRCNSKSGATWKIMQMITKRRTHGTIVFAYHCDIQMDSFM